MTTSTEILHQASAGVEALADRLIGILTALPALSAATESGWTVRDTAAHLVSTTSLYAELAAGVESPIRELTPEAIASYNAARLADVGATEPGQLAKALRAAVDQFLDAGGGRPGEQPVAWHGGIRLDLAQLTGVLVAEYLIHGYDICAAAGVPWPISREHVAFSYLAGRPTMPHSVDPVQARGHTATYRLDLSPLGTTTVRFAEGVAAVVADQPPDCEIVADPVAFLLVRWGRLARAAAIALGLLRFDGPRADLGPAYFDLFRRF